MIRRFLGGVLGPYVVGAVFGILLLIAAVQAKDARDARSETADMLAERNAALKNLGACQANVVTLEGAIATRDAEIARQSADASARLLSQQAALDAALKAGKAAQSRIAALSKPLVGVDQCVRMLELAERVK